MMPLISCIFFNEHVRTMLNLTLTGPLHVAEKAGKI